MVLAHAPAKSTTRRLTLSLVVSMPTITRRSALIAVAFTLMTKAAPIFAAGADDSGDGHDGKHEPAASSSSSAAPAASLADALKRKQTPPPTDVDDNWPTDDFGRPLRSCDVPWDFVPRKE